MYDADWSQPNPAAIQDPAGPPVEDSEPLVKSEPLPNTSDVLSELGAFYPLVAYPEAQASESAIEEVDRTIYSGLVNG